MCVSSGILFLLGFHLSRDLSVCHKYFNTALVRIGLLSSIGPWIVELSSPSYRDPSTYSFVLFNCPFTLWVRHLRVEGPMGWQFKIQGMTVSTQTRELYPPLTGCPENIYYAWHVSCFHWILSRIEASLRLPCTSPINITPLLSHFSIFCWEHTVWVHPSYLSETTPFSCCICHQCTSFVH